MRAVGFEYEVFQKIEISGRELKQIRDVGRRHYDSRCKSAVVPGPNGFVHGWIIRWFFSSGDAADPQFALLDIDSPGLDLDQTIVITASNHDLQIVAKIGEMEPYTSESTNFCGQAISMLRSMTQEHNRINKGNPRNDHSIPSPPSR